MIKSANFFAGWLGILLIAGGHSLLAQANGQADGSKALLNRLQTGVYFHSSDAALQRLFDAAETKGAANIVPFTPAMKVLIEGGAYNNAWIETQPMGGEMYAKRNLEVALNNQLVFICGQRADGRLPGMVISGEAARKSGQDKKPPEGMAWVPGADILADYEMLQGYCFPDPAWKMYFWVGKDREYLRKLGAALEAHDAYLWRTRDSNGDGLLESWCAWDTGEDNSSRYATRNAPSRWPFDFPPVADRLPDPQDPRSLQQYWPQQYWEEHKPGGNLPPPARSQVLVPFASMDLMSFSYDGRATLAKIARELGNGREEFWREEAGKVRRRLMEGLWDPDRHACFDRDRTGKPLEELIHNNLRAMYFGIFTQPMADAFIRHHLLNPAEFWTRMPLPSIAVNEPLFRNHIENDWSGQPEGLTYQRAIRALENYGHFVEVTLLGRKLIEAVGREFRFTQQFDPFTGTPTSKQRDGYGVDGYGPTILATLEYISRMHGIHLDVENDRVWWSGLAGGGKEFTYTQRWGDRIWVMAYKQEVFTARLNNREVFSCTAGVRVVTDLEGKVCEVVGIDSVRRSVVLRVGGFRHKFNARPNQVYQLDGSVLRAAPFDYPHRG
jgi:hypothetical protein